ncbi:ATPase [Xylariomycetidae sp. FL0641]|nr:ATPase [Xylariomycetidae sp. FL0641]
MTANSTIEQNPASGGKEAAATAETTEAPVTSTEPQPPVGSVSSIKNIYRSEKDDDDEWTWTEEYPKDVKEAAENEETQKYAVVVRNQKSKDSRKKLEAHSLVIQSPWLKTALGEILKDYPGVACELKRLEFDAPFEPFVHRWAEFVDFMKRPDLDAQTKEHLSILHGILKYEIGDSIAAFEDYVLNGVITFNHLWMIFPPACVVLSGASGSLSAYEVDETEYKQTQCGNFLRVRSDCVDHNGKRFGRCCEKLDIPEFAGTKPITGLEAFPLAFHEDKESVRAMLVARGRVFEKLAGHHYKSYDGKAITWDRENNEVPVTISGRIVVDINSFGRFGPYRPRRHGDWQPKDLEGMAELAKANEGKGEGEETFQLTPYHHMLARSRTRGYSLKTKLWLEFFVEHVGEITWNSDAFDALVLPEDQKELILAFSESQLGGVGFDDVISGKGKGVICLLSGPPGVGKTLTAEAVAETLQVPLHTLSSGDLGTDSWELEQALSRILELVARWEAILLLDECDVFLEARSAHDLERNKVVSVFLRTLEYYQGILFMTTNRVANIDPAFQSRIHVSLEYPDLTPASRRAIWANFLRHTTLRSEVADEEVDEFAQLPLNGRQIKNVLKTSQLLASRKKSPLRKEFIDTVLSIEKRRPDVQTSF